MSISRYMKRQGIALLLAAVLVIGFIPAPRSFAEPVTIAPIYAAAFMGSDSVEGTTLPTTLVIGEEAVEVNWLLDEQTFAVPYAKTVEVAGKTTTGADVTAQVEVIGPASSQLLYFVDSGRGGDSVGNGASASPYHTAVAQLVGDMLVNKLPDQRYVSGETSWGFDDSVSKVKNSKDGKHTDPASDPSIRIVGLRAVNDHIIYKLEALQSGSYTLTSGFHDWYGNRSREIRPDLSYVTVDGEEKLISMESLNTQATQLVSNEFSVPTDIDMSKGMTLSYSYVSGEKSILSWFAIAEGSIKGILEGSENPGEPGEEPDNSIPIVLDGNDIAVNNLNGLTFKGFGVLSANSTSALLMDYKSEQPEAYAQLLRVLFGGEKPLMTHVKIEMGNDRNNSTGPDPATMRTADEEANVTRHPGFQLAADAKALNPDLQVSILRWSAPAWADNNNDLIYKWYKDTILAAYREYGYMVNFVNPHINEHAPDLKWTKQYAQRVKTDDEGFASDVEKELYRKIKAVISDEVGIGSFGGSMISDAELREAAPIAGYHYNTDDDGQGSFKRLAEEFGIEIWNSEAQATFSNSSFRPNNNVKDPSAAGTGIGGTGSALEMGNTIVKGFVNSRRTHFIYQPAIGSFYEGGQYSYKELVSARDPWSGWIHYDAGLTVLQHFSWFANVGWENEDNTAGIWRMVPQASSTGAVGTNPVDGRNGVPNYVTMAAPDKTNFSTVIVNDSEQTKIYKIKAENMSYTGTPQLEIWETRAAEAGERFNRNYMQLIGEAVAGEDGYYRLTVKPFSIVTVSTLVNKNNEAYQTPLPVEGERTVLDISAGKTQSDTAKYVLYADDFDYTGKKVPLFGANASIVGHQDFLASRGGAQGAYPLYSHDRNGAFEAYMPSGSDNYVLRQQIDKAKIGLGGTWNSGDPVTAIGDNRWLNYKASVDVSFENNDIFNGENYAAVGARYQGGGSSHSITGTPYVLKFWFDGGWQLLVNNRNVASGNVATGEGVQIEGFDTAYNAWHKLGIQVAGAEITAYLDGHKLASYTDPSPKLSGRVDLASGYYHTLFDNLVIEAVEGYAPYYDELLDNLEMNDLSEVPQTRLVYGGDWDHRNGLGMFYYQRSISTNKEDNATMSLAFTGTGLDILGPNDGSAKLEVTVDGERVVLADQTRAVGEIYQTYALRGLSYGKHEVQIKVISGKLAVDAVGVVSGKVKGTPNLAALRAAVAEAKKQEKLDSHSEIVWSLFQNTLAAAEQGLVKHSEAKLDQEGANQLVTRLKQVQNQLLMGDIRDIAPVHYSAAYVGTLPTLPQLVKATKNDGSSTEVEVKWNIVKGSFNKAYETVKVTGSLGNLQTTAFVEVVPKDMAYFADVNGTESALGYISPAYQAVVDLLASSGKQLLNDVPDQLYNGTNGWGHSAYRANGTPENNYKGPATSGDYSKLTTTGMYTANPNGSTILYYLGDLPAGKYTIALGSHSWWAPYPRVAELSLSYGEVTDEVVDSIGLNNTTPNVLREYEITLEEASTVILKLKGVERGESPMLSFVAAAPVSEEGLDTVKPVLTLAGEKEVKVEQGAVYVDAGVTALDDRDGDISHEVEALIYFGDQLVPAIDTQQIGTYTYIYRVSDAAGNVADEVSRTVVVYEKKGGGGYTPPYVAPVVKPEDTQSFTASDLSKPVNGSIELKLAEKAKHALLPSNIGELVGENNLRITVQPGLAIVLEKADLQQALSSLNEAQKKIARLQLSIERTAQKDVLNTIRPEAIGEGVKLLPAGDAYELQMQIVQADGKRVAVAAAMKLPALSFTVDSQVNRDLVGAYQIAADGSLTYVGGKLEGNQVHIIPQQLGKYAVLAYEKTFADVSSDSWASAAIRKMAARHVIEGVTAERFAPQGKVTRAEFAAMLVRGLGIQGEATSSFTDVAQDAWYAGAVASAVEAGLVRGRSADSFAPNAQISREEMAVMLVRAHAYLSGKAAEEATNRQESSTAFGDQAQISSWAQESVEEARALGLLQGRSGLRFAPKEAMTRAEAAQVLANLLP